MRFIFFIISFQFISIFGQEFKPFNGIEPSKAEIVALTNVTIVIDSKNTIENGTLLVQNDKILKVGKSISIPKNAVELDYTGKIIYPAFIECNSSLGIPKPQGKESFLPQFESSKNGQYYWNESIHPEIDPTTLYNFDEKASDEYLSMGFGIVAVHQNDGIIQGTSSVYSLNKLESTKQLVKKYGATHFSFNKGVSNQNYPSSQMGSIALLRQTFYDLEWYKNAKQKTLNLSLDALTLGLQNNLIFETEDKYEILRAEKIAKEFNLKFSYICSGNEYEILSELKNIKGNLILPLNFPLVYDVKDPYISKEIPLSDLKHWENAPYNPFLISELNLPIIITSKGLNAVDFWKNIKKAIAYGLPIEKAINALTLEPAKLLAIDKDFGTISEGKIASFMVYETDPFKNEVKLLEAWMLGERKIISNSQIIDIRGKYSFTFDNEYLTLEISGSKEKPEAKLFKKVISDLNTPPKGNKKNKTNTKPLVTDSLEVKVNLTLNGNDIILQFNSSLLKWNGNISLHGKINIKHFIIEGDGFLPNGKWQKWSAIKSNDFVPKPDNKSNLVKNEIPYSIWYPNMAFGFDEKPNPETIVIENVTLWTNEKDGIINDGTIVIDNGKIVFAGKSNAPIPSKAKKIDGKGKHLTPGIVDEHSHIAISKGVNEGSQAITSEVSISDVVKADDIDIYRQLSGGVTTSQLLHGSANPIGGQSAIIKLKWGHSPQEMLFPNAPKFIKFALGENVKQANWGDFSTIRFPQTRMGIEQLMYDAFGRAEKYQNEKLKKTPNFHIDLELEALSEILKKERFITCHSYIQSEINMLMHVADSFHFIINTFTHILEGYKVADKMKKHGVGASSFADWWAYKYEVNEAIPQNASLLTDMGIITAINSDDAEMGRRLNQEAAKSIKYGGMSEENALKMVTLNPAKLLHLDHKIGSLKPGKDADVVLWDNNPLSIEAKVILTIVDGEILYDAEKNNHLLLRNQNEKLRIISKMLSSIENGDKLEIYKQKKEGHFHCNTLGEEMSNEENNH
jgi:imidazolonepropionase-like amidohydrolase